MPLRFVGGGAYNFNQHQMELTAECHAPAILPPGEYPYCPLGQELFASLESSCDISVLLHSVFA